MRNSDYPKVFVVSQLALSFARLRCHREGRPWFAQPLEEEVEAAAKFVQWLGDVAEVKFRE